MPRNVLILKGSPRERGNSNTLAERCAEGARARGAQVESIYLHSLEIRPCDACDLCQEPGSGCAIQDDMTPLYPKLAAADVIVFSSPIYCFNISAQLKLLIDRTYGFQSSKWEEMYGKTFGVILTYGDTDLYTSGAINAIYTLESLVRFFKGQIVEIVHGSVNDPGEVERHPELLEQAYKLGQRLAE